MVVNPNDEISIGLTENRLDRLCNMFLLVVGDKYDRQWWRHVFSIQLIKISLAIGLAPNAMKRTSSALRSWWFQIFVIHTNLYLQLHDNQISIE
jgi:hypothetical protein